MLQKLSEKDIEAFINSHNGWTHSQANSCLQKKFKFKNFNEAFGWMTRVALVAEKMDHHPEWSNVWNKVDVNLITHDANGITSKDIKLAQLMDSFYK